MADALGWRKKFAVLAPSTNTIVEPDFYRMSVPGVTAHFSRIYIGDQDMGSREAALRLLDQIREEIDSSVQRVMTAEPDYMVMGMSSETFWGGVEGNRRFNQRIKDLSGLDVATGAEGCERALRAFNVKRVGLITPYQPVVDEQVIRYIEEMGFEVVATKGLRCPTAVSIAHVEEDALRQALVEVNSDKVDALVQMGTNLSMVQLADEAERWLGKPVIAINAAIWWMALRDNGIDDKVYGCGRLLREY